MFIFMVLQTLVVAIMAPKILVIAKRWVILMKGNTCKASLRLMSKNLTKFTTRKLPQSSQTNQVKSLKKEAQKLMIKTNLCPNQVFMIWDRVLFKLQWETGSLSRNWSSRRMLNFLWKISSQRKWVIKGRSKPLTYCSCHLRNPTTSFLTFTCLTSLHHIW